MITKRCNDGHIPVYDRLPQSTAGNDKVKSDRDKYSNQTNTTKHIMLFVLVQDVKALMCMLS